jgi:hypothetical protein
MAETLTSEEQAARTYFEATGEWPPDYTPPGEPTAEEKQKSAAQAYHDATGNWPGEKPKDVKDEEAPEGAFSHYLELADGQTVRFAIHPRRNNIPAAWNGVPVVRVHNSHAPGKETSDDE